MVFAPAVPTMIGPNSTEAAMMHSETRGEMTRLAAAAANRLAPSGAPETTVYAIAKARMPEKAPGCVCCTSRLDDALAEQRADQTDGKARGHVVVVESGVDLGQLHGMRDPAFCQHLHGEVRLAICQSARHGCSSPRRHGRIDRIDVETDV